MLLVVFSIYQYVQYQQQLEALKATDDSVSLTLLPVDTVAVATPPDKAYYNHHDQLSMIARYNPLLRATIQKKLYFYNYTKQNNALLDFYNLLIYRRLSLTKKAKPIQDSSVVEQQMQKYHVQLCKRWNDFAQHMKNTYPNAPKSIFFNDLCKKITLNYTQDEIVGKMANPITE